MEDITKTGPLKFNELLELNSIDKSIELPDYDFNYKVPTRETFALNEYMKLTLPDVFSTGENLGSSRYDKGIYTEDELLNIEDTRARELSAWSKWANSGVKMLGTFGTTFIDGTLGTLVGIGTGIINEFDDDENTSFISGMWDNAITRVTLDASNYLEDNFKNYRTTFEQNAAWYERLGTANFWSEGVLKNMGFMMGTAASMTAFGGLGKIIGLSKILDSTGRGGKAAGWMGRTLLSTVGESAIEAKHSMDANLLSIDLNIALLYEDANKELERTYSEKMAKAMLHPDEKNRELNLNLLLEGYKREKAELDNSRKALEAEKKRALITASNNIFLANMAFLAITNNINMGSLIRGGYNNSSDFLKHIRRLVDGKDVTDIKDFAAGVLKGTASYATEEILNLTGKTLGRAAINMAAEGFQEGGLKVASTSNEMLALAKLNKFVNSLKYEGTDGEVKPLFTHTLNPTVNEELANYTKALGETFKQEFGSIASPGWEEVFIGAVSSGIGTPTVTRSRSVLDGRVIQGPYKLSWVGNAFWEAKLDIMGDKPLIDDYVALLNLYILSPDMLDKIKAAVTSASINDALTKALLKGDIAQYKNLEFTLVVNSAIFFKNAGLMDDYMALYDSYAEGLTDKDLEELYALTYSSVSKDSPLSELLKEDIKNNIRKKALSTKKKIESVIDNYSLIYERHGDRFSPNYRNRAISELTFINALSLDIARRIDEMNLEIENTKGDDLGSIQKRLSLKKDIEKLTKTMKSLDNSFREYTKSPLKLETQLLTWLDEYDKFQIGKDASKTLERYKLATTIKDIWDIYRHTDDSSRDKVFDDAMKSASPEIKALMKLFKDFSSDIEAVEALIDRDNANLPEGVREQVIAYEKRWIRSLAEDIINDESPVVTRLNLLDKIEGNIQTIINEMDELLLKNDDGTYSIRKNMEDEYQYLLVQLETFRHYKDELDKLEITRDAGTPSGLDLEEKGSKDLDAGGTEVEVNTITVRGIEIKHTEDADSYPNDPDALAEFNKNLNGFWATEEPAFLEKIVDGIKSGIVIPSKIALNLSDFIEEYWKDIEKWYNSKYNKGESEELKGLGEGKTPPKLPATIDNSKEVALTKDSLIGHIFEKYRFSELATNKKLVPNPGAKELNDRYKILEFIDLYLSKVPAGTPIKYIHNPNYPNKVFLGIKLYNIFSLGVDRNKVTVVTTNDGDYVIMGTLGYDAKNNPLTATLWELINRTLEEEYRNSGSAVQHFVGSKYNEVKDITGGLIVITDGNRSRTLEELLSDRNTNPHELTMNSLKFAVVEGTVDKPVHRFMRVNSSDTLYDHKGNPGLIILYIPDGKGNYVPTVLDPVFWKDVGHNKSVWRDYLFDITADLFEAILDEDSKQAVKKLAELRDLLLFGTGNNIFYNKDSNTLTYQVNGTEVFLVESGEELITTVLNKLNPQIKINLSILRSNPGFYGEILRTNLAVLGTLGSLFYLYPVNNKGDMIKNQPVLTSPRPNLGRNTLSILYYNDKQYKTDGTNIYDYLGNALNDSKLELELEVILGILNDKYPLVIISSNTYYETPLGVFISKQKGYRKLTQLEELKYKEKKLKLKEKEALENKPPVPPNNLDGGLPGNTEGGSYRENLERAGVIRKDEVVGYITSSDSNRADTALSELLIRYLRSAVRKVLEDPNASWDTLHNAIRSTAHKTATTVNTLTVFRDAQLALREGRVTVEDIMLLLEELLYKEVSTPDLRIHKENYNGEDANLLRTQKDLDNLKKNPIFVAIKSRENRARLIDAIQGTGYSGNLRTPADIQKALESLNVPIDNIENIDDIIDIINNCR